MLPHLPLDQIIDTHAQRISGLHRSITVAIITAVLQTHPPTVITNIQIRWVVPQQLLPIFYSPRNSYTRRLLSNTVLAYFRQPARPPIPISHFRPHPTFLPAVPSHLVSAISAEPRWEHGPIEVQKCGLLQGHMECHLQLLEG